MLFGRGFAVQAVAVTTKSGCCERIIPCGMASGRAAGAQAYGNNNVRHQHLPPAPVQVCTFTSQVWTLCVYHWLTA